MPNNERTLREQLGKVTADFRAFKQRSFTAALRDERLLHGRQRVQELEAELVKLRRQEGPSRVKEQIRSLRQEFEDRFKEYRLRAIAGQEIIRGLRETAETLRATIGELRSTIEALRSTIADLRANLDQRTDQAQTLKDQRDAALARIAELEGGAP
jgi:chromosome segregation ATPase